MPADPSTTTTRAPDSNSSKSKSSKSKSAIQTNRINYAYKNGKYKSDDWDINIAVNYYRNLKGSMKSKAKLPHPVYACVFHIGLHFGSTVKPEITTTSE